MKDKKDKVTNLSKTDICTAILNGEYDDAVQARMENVLEASVYRQYVRCTLTPEEYHKIASTITTPLYGDQIEEIVLENIGKKLKEELLDYLKEKPLMKATCTTKVTKDPETGEDVFGDREYEVHLDVFVFDPTKEDIK